ncbi:MAG: ATP-grasp domain-containing protein, partial [Planctomycetota bacterium]
MDVALATCDRLPEPDHDAAPLAVALAAAGITSEVLAWDDPTADWSRARMAVLRSTWNYALDRPAFVRWAEAVSSVSQLWNPLPVVSWSTHKRYLLELEEQGVPIVPTVFIEHGSRERLTEICPGRGWGNVIVKPAVSASSYRTRRFGPGGLEAGEAHLSDLAATGDVLVQQYLHSVEDYGERGLIWIDGELTHAVRKRRRLEGDDESVSGVAVEITPDEADLARRAIACVEGPILYGRVDVAPLSDGRPVVMEL